MVKILCAFWKQAGYLEPQGSSGHSGSWELGDRGPHQLCQDRQEDDDGGRVAGELREEGDDDGDEQHCQQWGDMLQGVQLPTDPCRQPRLLWADIPLASVHPVPPFTGSH